MHMTERDPREDYEFYEDEENLRPQGPPRRRESGLTEMLPVRVSPSLLDALRDRAKREERSVSWVVRRATQRYLDVEGGEGSGVDDAIHHIRAALDALQRARSRESDESAAAPDPRAREELRDWLREVRKQVEEADLDPSVVDEAIAAVREMR